MMNDTLILKLIQNIIGIYVKASVMFWASNNHSELYNNALATTCHTLATA